MWFANLKSTSQIFPHIECTSAICPPFQISYPNFSYFGSSAQINILWLRVFVMIHLKIWNFYHPQILAQIVKFGVVSTCRLLLYEVLSWFKAFLW